MSMKTLMYSDCFPDADRMEVEAPEVHETTLFANEKEAFALEPVAITRKHNTLPWAHKNLCA